jgi:hypothetical protein
MSKSSSDPARKNRGDELYVNSRKSDHASSRQPLKVEQYAAAASADALHWGAIDPGPRRSLLSPCRMAATICVRHGVMEAMDSGHSPVSRRDHRFGFLRGCACARREAVPERLHLSGLQRGEWCPDLPSRETTAAGAATRCRPHGATGYLAAGRWCASSTTTRAPGISIRTVCYPLAVRRRHSPQRGCPAWPAPCPSSDGAQHLKR